MAKILIVDDHPDNRRFLLKLLGYGAHELFEAVDGIDALRVVRQEHPDLVITDILMPTMDGYEFVRQLRADTLIRGTKVIFHSAAYHEREIRPLAKAMGVVHILNKPAKPEQVLAVVAAALGGSAVRLTSTPAAQFRNEHLRVVSDKLLEKAEELETANLKLAALIEMGQQLHTERVPVCLLDHCAHASRKLLGARQAVVAILAEDQERFAHTVASGVDAQSPGHFERLSPAHPVIAAVLSSRQPQCLANFDEPALMPPSISSPCPFLGVSITSPTRGYGVLYFVGRISSAPFSDEDERLATLAATNLAIAYENILREEKINKHIEELDQCVKERTAELQRSNADLEQFAYVASHDLQEPLRKVIGYTQLLGERYKGQLDADADEFIGYAVDGGMRMQSLIRDLLEYSRVGSKGKAFTLLQCEAILDRALGNLQVAVKESAAVVTHDLLPELMGDETQLVQLFQNLLGNAIKFCKVRSPIIQVCAHRKAAEWLFSIRDNGIGIEPQFLDRIFVIFQRLHTRTEFPGTGIGLAICRKIVEKHGGRLWVESQPDQGSVFYFTLSALVNENSLKE